VLLDKSGIVESVCPATRTRIRIEVTPDGVRPVDPPDAVVSEVRPDHPVEDMGWNRG
jgi:alkylmercury lyase